MRYRGATAIRGRMMTGWTEAQPLELQKPQRDTEQHDQVSGPAHQAEALAEILPDHRLIL